jgi:nucleoside-diphosphate-sugar epimerase
MNRALIIGSAGQIGTELRETLAAKYGKENVLATDIRPNATADYPFEVLDILDNEKLLHILKEGQFTEVYLLAAMLSATAEKIPLKGWALNMDSLFNVLEAQREGLFQKLFFPSSIAVFGNNTPKNPTPQETTIEPATVYGISKQSGEQWCAYYKEKYGCDIRSIRYPGLISYKTLPGGGTTDYAVQIFYDAIEKGHHTCFLNEDTRLPMMYMSDAIRGTIELMEAPKDSLAVKTSYNFAAFSFTPAELAEVIKKSIPEFTISYEPDFRQGIANSWPQVIEDSAAQKDWNWSPEYNLEAMATEMINNLKLKLAKA